MKIEKFEDSEARRSTASIAEGFERGGDEGFIQALSGAKGSRGEHGSQMYVARDEEYVSVAQFGGIPEKARIGSRLVGGFVKYFQASKRRGSKFMRRDQTATQP